MQVVDDSAILELLNNKDCKQQQHRSIDQRITNLFVDVFANLRHLLRGSTGAARQHARSVRGEAGQGRGEGRPGGIQIVIRLRARIVAEASVVVGGASVSR